jgi:DNA-binding HxlR family transcriptional regulator
VSRSIDVNIPFWHSCDLVALLPARKAKSSSKDPSFAAVEAIKRVGIECRLVVVIHLLMRPMRFNELLKIGIGIDPKTLSRVLKYLVSEGIVQRNVLSTQPFEVQYALTEKGKQLRPVVDSLDLWGETWILPQPKIVVKD